MVKSNKISMFVINHVFMPLKLPQKDDLDKENEQSLCLTVCDAAQEFSNYLDEDQRHQWNQVQTLLENFTLTHQTLALSEDEMVRSFRDLKAGGNLAFYIRAQNAAVIIRKGPGSVIFELFEVSPLNEEVMKAKGKLLRSFPDPAVQIPRTVFDDPIFQDELAGFLAAMDVDVLDSSPTTKKSGTAVLEVRETAHPRYITQLLTEILRGMGEAVEIPRVIKRMADDILWSDAYKPWRRSAVWLVLRVALQTTLVRQSSGIQTYKAFIAFLHAKILKESLELDLPSYLIDCMQKKLARRIAKLGNATPPFLLQFGQEALDIADNLLQRRWATVQSVQETSLSSNWAPQTLDIAADTALSLHNSRKYLQHALKDTISTKSTNPFLPRHTHRILGAANFTKTAFGGLAEIFQNSGDPSTALADFERAVLTDLKEWATKNLHSSNACESLATCITEYHSAASKQYSSNPELLSTMILTLFKLWVEVDRIAVVQCDLLKKFSPEIPLDLLHPLLLRSSESIEALQYVEDYLKTRHLQAVPGQSVFSRSSGNKSFAGQYFDQYQQVQNMKEHIERAAEKQKEKKIEQLRKDKRRYHDLIKEAEAYEHEFGEKRKKGKLRKVHARNCTKCKREKEAADMKIAVHEWPLPQDVWEAKTVVFELSPPLPFVTWRYVTYFLLRDVCIPNSTSFPKDPVRMQLQQYPALTSRYKQPGIYQRIILASTTKSFHSSHYQTQAVSSATEWSVCVEHGLTWNLYDSNSERSEWVTPAVANCSINGHCTIQLPPGRYQRLQYAVSGTSHTSNDIMAKQTECPPDLTLHEFIAFCGIRSGPRLQWLNILSELRAGSLTFQEEAVCSLLRQAIWQIGPSVPEDGREWHIDPTEKMFGETLLSELRSLLIRLKANRRNVTGMQVITSLVSRLLVSAVDDNVVNEGFNLLREVREVTYGWLEKILPTLGDVKEESHLKEWQMHVCEVAAACRGTYDVDLAKAPTLLSSSEDVAVFLHCAILLNHNSPLNVSDSDPRLRDILSRDRRLSHLLEPLLSQRIAESREGFDQAIHRRWSLYHSSSPLEHMASPNNRWVTTTTTAQDTQKPQTVHLNLLSGQILIDGKPLGRLPKEILTHPMYIRIFGQRIMEVVPSDLPGMEYKTSSPIGSDLANDDSGYHVFFTYQEPMWYDDQAQLVIRTKRDEEVLELIPHDTFKNDLPVVLINDHTHWLNISDKKGEIEIRSIQLCWKSSPHNWRIQFSPHGSSSMSREDNNSDKLELIDTRSRTMDMIATTLQPVENREYMVVTYSSSSDRLHVSLPRFRLEFFLNLKDGMEAQLESLNMPGMFIDSNQSSGTMLGLRSQLLLRLKDSPQPSLRQVIIPYVPDPRFLISPSRYHVSVTLDLGDQPTMRYFLYTVNSTLGRLDSDGTMLSKLYQIYLHAITSHCLPDPLTGCTGTEESLQGLRSAAMLSFQKLGEDECRMLKQISGLTPSRTYYPTHLKGMQTVTWSKHAICPLAQHSDFYVLTRSIWEYATTLSWLTEFRKDPQHVDSRETSDHLLQRAACRNALCYRHPVATSVLPSEQHDLLYQSRSRSTYTKEAEEVFNTSAMIFNWEARLASPCGDLFNALKHYGSISGPTKISLSYSREWLEPTIQDIFLSAINACRTASKANRYQMVFGLSACAYASVDARPFIPIIFAFAVIPGLRVRPLPDWQIYDLLLGPGLNEEKLSETVRTCTMLYNASSAGTKKAKLQVVTGSQEPEVRELVKILKEQWPCEKPVIPTSSYEWTFSIYQLQREAASLFQSCLQNKALFDYLQGVQEIINHVRQPALVLPTVPYTPPPVTVRPYPVFNNISFQQLLITRPAPIIPLPPSTPQNSTQLQQEEKTQDTRQLRELLLEFRKSTCLSPRGTTPVAIQEQYANDLEASLQSLELEGEIASCRSSSGPQIATVALYQQHQHQCEMHLQVAYHLIRDSLSPSTRPDKALLTAGLWPCLSRKSLLGALSFGSGVAPTVEWRKTLNSFARAVLVFQRSCRLTKYLHARKLEDFYSEIGNRMMETEDDDDDEQCSIRLLIQADSNFLARQLQIDFIKEMTCPSSKGNTVLQLNMGEGKSSVIVPIAAGVLSDGNKLVRVVVLRPLAPSMIQILVHRLGGLANRRVFYLPFCRTPRLTSEQAEQVQQIFLTCVRVRGVLVVQPDHILSFRLMGLDRMPDTTTRFASTESNTANRLLESQRWLFNNSRDILDESDEILHVKYQLVYTVGRQQSLHGSPDRWTIAQEILALVGKHARTINRFYPDGFEMIEDHAGGYPRIRILRDYAGKTLIDRVADDILNGALGHFSFDLFPPKIRSVVLSYLTSLEATSKDIRLVEDYCKSSDSWKTLLTLRGILAHGILQFVLKEKRWRVDYGPDPSRSLLAVPFRAKDVPCLRAEFSHPDVAILLTCLNYYWQGLSQSQLEQCFSLLLKQDSPALEYSKWILHSAVPEPLRHLGSINLRDLDQRLELYQIFHKSQAVINFFLSQVVFPRDAKEFPRKMATSGWDLAESKAHVTTGFSGTNDGRYLLPTSISQDDPLSQSSTNARVLMYLLHPENDSYHCLSQNGQQNSEQSLLRLVVKQRPEIRVLLDVGAQILELSNEEVVTQWLELNGNPDIHAAVFYGTNDEPYVRTRNGVTEEFVSSHFRQQMDKCLLYLDDAHTRGSDFKLPSGTRAAVTLGPKVTKDRLVQGCMRMRRLGRGHTVTFFAPPEVDHSIRVSAGLRYHYRVRTKDIVLWTMFESCFEVLHRIPQWAQQGMDHRKREVAWREFNQSPISSINQLVTAWLQNEARSLDEMYALDQADPMSSFSSRLEQCPDISSRYRDWAPSSSTDTHFQEEQEREIIFEVETERQVERPATAVAAHHRVESDVRLLIQRGQFAKSSAFVSIFPQLSQPSFEESSWSSPGLYCTKDFSITIQGSRYDNSSDYLRPVNWILSSVQADIGRIFVILSPFEVNELLPDIRLSTKVRLHQFVPRTTQEMKSCEDLDFNCIPPLISPWVIPSLDTTTRLNLLAGQLYLEDKRAYHHLCDFLGLYSWQPQRGDIIKSDGFIMPHHRDGTPVTISPFQTSPVPYLKQLFAARRKGMDYTSTHMGKILRGRLLTKEDFPAS